MTLCHLAERLRDKPVQTKMLRIGIIEKEGEMWTGVPYGRRSVIGALTFQKLQEFLEEPERSCYIEWLRATAGSWLQTLREWGGSGAAKWISDNQSLMDQDKWGELYLPRFLFGLYVSSQAACAVEELSRLGLASVTRIQGEAVGISGMPGRPRAIDVEDDRGARRSLHAERVVLAIGSPPQKAVQGSAVTGRPSHVYINDMYSPSETASMYRIQKALSALPDKTSANLLILGSNASALEALYLINYRPRIRHRINSIVIFSHSGLLPYKISEETVEFRLLALEELRIAASFCAADLMAAISSDIRRAEAFGLNIADLRDLVGVAVNQSIDLMHVREQERFICEHGVHYSRMMRRAGRDTRNAADELVDQGILTTVRGALRRLEPFPSGSGLMRAVYTLADEPAEMTYPVPFRISINCGGFEDLDCSSSRLINSLVSNRICKVNSTRRGFLVDENLKASENVYVIGPLVAGNFNDRIRFWHVESASRISGLAKLLAESLFDSLFLSSEAALSSTMSFEEDVTSVVSPSSL